MATAAKLLVHDDKAELERVAVVVLHLIVRVVRVVEIVDGL